MLTTAVCPQCQTRFEVPRDLADQPVRCSRCLHTFRWAEAANAIQAGLPRVTASDDYDPHPAPSPRHPTARPAFPLVPILVLAIGLLILLLAISVGFNLWQMKAAHQLMQDAMPNDDVRPVVVDAKVENPGPAWGELQGRVVWKGELPKIESLEEKMRSHPDWPAIMKAPKEMLLDPTCRIEPNTKGIANVCVFLKRPADRVMPIHPDDKVRKDSVIIDAPFCVYQPHMVALYPEWFDGKNREATGQTFLIKNSSPVAQNYRLIGNPNQNPGFGLTYSPKSDREIKLHAQMLPVMIVDDIHPWMKAHAWVFDHPYFAITGNDGTFTIPRCPIGIDVQVMAWHESQGWLFTKDGKTLRLGDRKNVLDFEMGPPNVN